MKQRLSTRDPARLADILDRAVKGETFTAIGTSLTPPLSRERVRQLLKTLGVTSRDFVRAMCVVCGDPIYGQPGPTGAHYCSKRECHLTGHRERARAISPTFQLPRAVCANCGETMKQPAKATVSFCMKTLACRAARMRHRYATSEYHRAYSAATVRKNLESGKQREYTRTWQAKLPNTKCAKCGADTGRKTAQYCDGCRGMKRRPAGYILGPNKRREKPAVPTGPHPSIVQFRKMVHDPNFARLHALYLLKVDGLSERAVAKQTGIKRATLNGWSLGVRQPKLRTYFDD